MLRVLNNEQLDVEKKRQEPVIPERESKNEELFLSQLSAHVRKCWEAGKTAKRSIEAQMLKNLRQIKGEYESDKLAAIRSIGQPEVFVMTTDTKCRAAQAWVKDILFPPDETPWDIRPTPIPELSPEIEATIKQKFLMKALAAAYQEVALAGGGTLDPQAVINNMQDQMPDVMNGVRLVLEKKSKEICANMKKKIDDQLTEGNWYQALDDTVFDIISSLAGIIKGPVFVKEKKRTPKVNPQTGKVTISIEEVIVPKYSYASPFDIYPAPNSNDIDDLWLIHHIHLTPRELNSLIGAPGFDDDEIRAVLEEHRAGGLKEWTAVSLEVKLLENKDSSADYNYEKIDALEYWGSVQGKALLEWGIKPLLIDDPMKDYDVCCWLIGRHVIKAMLNPDPLGQKPFSKASFVEKPNCFWGSGLPQVVSDLQGVLNAIARALVNNVGLASGPQVERNIDRIPSGQSATMWPWKVWDVTDAQMGNSAPALNFYQPQMFVEKLVFAYQHFSKLFDEHSGVPGYVQGNTDVSGAGKALANYEKILTPTGPVEIGKAKIGDLVVTTYGETTEVTGVFPQGESDVFRVKFSNGEHIDCDMEHRWSVRTHHDRKFKTFTTEQILKAGLFRKTKTGERSPKGWRPRWMLPLINCVEFKKRDVAIDPYTMGALLGDGDARARITSEDKNIFNRIPYPLGKRDCKRGERAWAHTIKGVKTDYIKYGLNCKSISKFIPDDYLFNSKEVRLELLRGLLDTDGCCSSEGQTFFSTSSHRLAKDFVRLMRSLGGIVCSICEVKGGEFIVRDRKAIRQDAFRITFNLPGEQIFHLQRKQKRVKEKERTHIYITGIEYVGQFHATCITVDSKDSLFICENFIPTHNTASGLSMLMNNAARGIKNVLKTIDSKIISRTVERQYYWNIEQGENADLICDNKIVAKGSSSMIAKEQQAVRRTEFLAATANPFDMQVLGPDGRRFLLKEAAKSQDIDVSELFPDELTRLIEQASGGGNQWALPEAGGIGAPGAPGSPVAPGAAPASPPGIVPAPAAQKLDASGRPVVGQDFRTFNQ
jgi:hypothetical protein